MKEFNNSQFLNIPNIITLFRTFSVGIIMVMLALLKNLENTSWNFKLSLLASLIYLFVALSDTVDGILARRWNLVTDFGKLLDPIADKALIVATGIMLVPLGRAPAWVIALIIIREIVITGIRSIASLNGFVISASSLGKAKTFTQNTAFIFLILHFSIFKIPVHLIGTIILYIALLLTWISGIDYIVKYAKRK